MKISDLFFVTTGERIIESEVYLHKGIIPCVTSQTSNNGITWYADEDWLNKEHKENIIYDKCITWTKDGVYAGKLFYRDYPFYPNDHCGVLIPKPDYKDKINLNWFVYTQERYIMSNASQQNSKPMLYNNSMADIKITLPMTKDGSIDIIYQNKIVEQYDKLKKYKNLLLDQISKVETFLEKSLLVDFGNEYIKLEEIFNVYTGEVLTEDILYLHQGDIPYVTSKTTDNGINGYVDEGFLNQNYKSFQKKPSISWSIDGSAGTMFLQLKPFVYNNHCGVLEVKDAMKEKVNLKWFIYTFEKYIQTFSTTNEGLGKLGKNQMSNIPIRFPFPSIEKQLEIVDIYEKVEKKRELMSGVLEKINKILS